MGYARQTERSRSKIAELDFVRLRVRADLAALVDSIGRRLRYLQEPFKSPLQLAIGGKSGQSISRDTLKRLMRSMPGAKLCAARWSL
jgi:hypothetical protein